MPAWFDWNALSAVGAVIAAAFAGIQIRSSRLDANNRAVLEHLRTIGDKALRAGYTPVEVAQQEVLDYYSGSRPDLTAGAEGYLDLLNSLDLLAFAVQAGMVNKKKANEHIRTLISPSLLSQTFLKKFQKCCGDGAVYEHLYNYFVELLPSTAPPEVESGE
jgi:hypothetical protein